MALNKIIVALAAAATLGIGVAQAADLPMRTAPPVYIPPPVFTWTGGYLGSIVGIDFLDGRAESRCTTGAGVPFGAGCAVIPNRRLRSTSYLFGATSGYNLQFGQFVVGIETDFQGTGLDKTNTAVGPFGTVGGGPTTGAASAFVREQIDAFGTVRGRLGYSWNRTLLYVTGGIMYADVNLSSRDVFPVAAHSYIGHSDSARIGAVVGGGLEYAFTDHWSGKVEGLVYDLGNKSVVAGETTGANGAVLGNRFRVEGALVRVGLNYKFGDSPLGLIFGH